MNDDTLASESYRKRQQGAYLVDWGQKINGSRSHCKEKVSNTVCTEPTDSYYNSALPVHEMMPDSLIPLLVINMSLCLSVESSEWVKPRALLSSVWKDSQPAKPNTDDNMDKMFK